MQRLGKIFKIFLIMNTNFLLCSGIANASSSSKAEGFGEEYELQLMTIKNLDPFHEYKMYRKSKGKTVDIEAMKTNLSRNLLKLNREMFTSHLKTAWPMFDELADRIYLRLLIENGDGEDRQGVLVDKDLNFVSLQAIQNKTLFDSVTDFFRTKFKTEANPFVQYFKACQGVGFFFDLGIVMKTSKNRFEQDYEGFKVFCEQALHTPKEFIGPMWDYLPKINKKELDQSLRELFPIKVEGAKQEILSFSKRYCSAGHVDSFKGPPIFKRERSLSDLSDSPMSPYITNGSQRPVEGEGLDQSEAVMDRFDPKEVDKRLQEGRTVEINSSGQSISYPGDLKILKEKNY